MVGPNDPTYDLIYGIAMEPLQDMANSANLIKICTPFDKEMASIDLNLHKTSQKTGHVGGYGKSQQAK